MLISLNQRITRGIIITFNISYTIIHPVKYDTLARFYKERRNDKTRFDYNRDIDMPGILKAIGSVKDKTVLDLGCGFGDLASRLSRRGAKKIIGIDNSKAMIQLATEQNIKKCAFQVGDMNKKLPFKDNSFDMVVSSLAFHYVKNLKGLYKEIHRVLKKDGILVFTTGHPIFDLINQSPDKIIGFKGPKGKRKIIGNYFDESAKDTRLGALGVMKLYSYTLETFIMKGIETGFELLEYRDLKPVPSSKDYDKAGYEATTTLPSFIMLKFKR